MFQELCGRDNFQNVVLVTTMWNEVSQDEGQRREEELQNDFWHLMIRLGSTTHRFDLTEDSAWDIIDCISVSPPDERRPLRIQLEMVDEGKPIHRTSAGKAVPDRINGIFSNAKRFFRRSNKNTKGRKGQIPVPLQHHRFSRSSSVSSLTSYVSHTSDLTSCSVGSSSETPSDSLSDSTEPLNEQSYRAALGNAINFLKLIQSIVEVVPVCLKEAIAPALSIAQTIEVIAVFEFIVHTRIEFLP